MATLAVSRPGDRGRTLSSGPRPAGAGVCIRHPARLVKPTLPIQIKSCAIIPGKPVRQLDPAHLALVRQCPCLVCGSLPSEAAHVRTPSAAHGKRACGMGSKPDDKWTLPLCHQHHMEQHQEGELTFYFRLNVSPVQLSQDLYRVSPDLDAMRRIVREARC